MLQNANISRNDKNQTQASLAHSRVNSIPKKRRTSFAVPEEAGQRSTAKHHSWGSSFHNSEEPLNEHLLEEPTSNQSCDNSEAQDLYQPIPGAFPEEKKHYFSLSSVSTERPTPEKSQGRSNSKQAVVLPGGLSTGSRQGCNTFFMSGEDSVFTPDSPGIARVPTGRANQSNTFGPCLNASSNEANITSDLKAPGLAGRFEGLNLPSTEPPGSNLSSQTRPIDTSLPHLSSGGTLNHHDYTGAKGDRISQDKLTNPKATYESPRKSLHAADISAPDVDAAPGGPVSSSQLTRKTHFRPGLRQEKTTIFNADEKARLRAEDARALERVEQATFNEPEKTTRGSTQGSSQKNVEYQPTGLKRFNNQGDQEVEYRAQQREKDTREDMENTKRTPQRVTNSNPRVSLSNEQNAAGVFHNTENVSGEVDPPYSSGAYVGANQDEWEFRPDYQATDRSSIPHSSDTTQSKLGHELDSRQGDLRRTEHPFQSDLLSVADKTSSQQRYGKPQTVGAPLRAEYFRSPFSEIDEQTERLFQEEGYLASVISDHKDSNETPIDGASMEAIFSRETGLGILPGYPSEEAMNYLIAERLYDDHIRATGNGIDQRTGPSYWKCANQSEMHLPHWNSSACTHGSVNDQDSRDGGTSGSPVYTGSCSPSNNATYAEEPGRERETTITQSKYIGCGSGQGFSIMDLGAPISSG